MPHISQRSMTTVTLTYTVRGVLTLMAVCLMLMIGRQIAGQAAPDSSQNTRRQVNPPLSACTAEDLPGDEVEKIVFSSTRDKPVPDPGTLPQVNLEIYIMNPDGTDPVRLTNNGVNDSFAALAPNRKGWIVFDSARGAPPGSPPNLTDLYLMRSDGSNVQYLTRGSSASWSPDSRSIAFHRSASGTGLPVVPFPGGPAIDSDIFVANVCDLLAGVPPTNITNSVGIIDTDPSWSPDGTRIVFTRFSATDNLQNPTGAEVFTIHPDGTGLTQLTFNSVEERAPQWSNDGTRIVYACKQGTVPPDSDLEICVMNADGTGQTQLTFDSTAEGTMSFSPDDQKILFHNWPNGAGGVLNQIFTINVDGTGLTQLTNTAGLNQFASWGFITQQQQDQTLHFHAR